MRRLPTLGSLALLLAATVTGAHGCRPDATPAADTVARVGDREIPFETFSTYLAANLGEPGVQIQPAVLSALLDQLLDEECLRDLAMARGLATEATPARAALEALLEEELGRELPRSLTRTYYEENREEFARPERVRLRQILVDDRQVAAEALAELERGERFAEVAARFSIEPRAQRGGEQGIFAREDLPSAFADSIFQLASGEVSEIIAADYGFHIFQVVERYPEEVLSYAAAAPEIRARLEYQQADAAQAELVAAARERCRAVVFPSNLPFPYRGIYAYEEDS